MKNTSIKASIRLPSMKTYKDGVFRCVCSFWMMFILSYQHQQHCTGEFRMILFIKRKSKIEKTVIISLFFIFIIIDTFDMQIYRYPQIYCRCLLGQLDRSDGCHDNIIYFLGRMDTFRVECLIFIHRYTHEC